MSDIFHPEASHDMALRICGLKDNRQWMVSCGYRGGQFGHLNSYKVNLPPIREPTHSTPGYLPKRNEIYLPSIPSKTQTQALTATLSLIPHIGDIQNVLQLGHRGQTAAQPLSAT